MTPLRIGIVAGASSPSGSRARGALEAHTHILARAQGDLGHDVFLFATGGPVAVPRWTALRAGHLRQAVALGGERLAGLVGADAAGAAARVVEEVDT